MSLARFIFASCSLLPVSFALAQAPTALVPPGAGGGGQLAARFGQRVAGIKNVDSDTRGDALVGVPTEDMPGGFGDCGRVYIYNGFSGALIRTINPLNKQPGGLFGFSLAGLDNINGDALGDFVVGAPLQHPGAAPLGAGRAYVIRGDTGVMIRAHKSPLEQADGRYGYAVAAVPDLNGDGRTDYMISAPWETVGQGAGARTGAGRVYLYSGINGALMKIFWSPNFEVDGHFGQSISHVPDTTGDGKAEILIGAPNDDPAASPTNCGRVYLFNGATFALIRVMASPFQEENGHYGWSVSGIANVNGDTRGDIIIGAPGDSPGNSPANCGRAYMYSGANQVYIRTLASPNQITGGEFGRVVAGTTDCTGDVFGDVFVSGPFETVNLQAKAGRVYVFSGASGSVFKTLTSPNNEIEGWFGYGMSPIPPPSFNLRPGVLVGAPQEDPGATPPESGRAYIYRN